MENHLNTGLTTLLAASYSTGRRLTGVDDPCACGLLPLLIAENGERRRAPRTDAGSSSRRQGRPRRAGEGAESLRALDRVHGEGRQRSGHAGLHMGDRRRAQRLPDSAPPVGFLVCHGHNFPGRIEVRIQFYVANIFLLLTTQWVSPILRSNKQCYTQE